MAAEAVVASAGLVASGAGVGHRADGGRKKEGLSSSRWNARAGRANVRHTVVSPTVLPPKPLCHNGCLQRPSPPRIIVGSAASRTDVGEGPMPLLGQQPGQTPYTWTDYLGWPAQPRLELIDGDAVAMSPAPGLAHQDAVLEIASQAKQFLEGKPCRAFVAPLDVRLPRANEADARIDTVVQPDVLVVCDPSKLDERGVRGAPDWVVEVISRGSASHDHVRKRRVYERSGVREYWLVHPLDRVLMVYRHDGQAYGRPDVQDLEGTTEVGVLPGLVIDWAQVVRWLPPMDEATAGGPLPDL